MVEKRVKGRGKCFIQTRKGDNFSQRCHKNQLTKFSSGGVSRGGIKNWHIHCWGCKHARSLSHGVIQTNITRERVGFRGKTEGGGKSCVPKDDPSRMQTEKRKKKKSQRLEYWRNRGGSPEGFFAPDGPFSN